MKLSSVLASIKGSDEKTASATSDGKPGPTEKTASTTEGALKAALREATEAPAQEKTAAAAASPVADLIKTANQMADVEHDALVKEANLYGAAVADGFMSRLSQYNEAAEKIGQQKVASAPSTAAPVTDSFEKFANENPALVKQAAELGYATAAGQIEKLAEAAHTAGYNQAVSTIYKVGHDSFSAGFQDTMSLLQELRQ